MDSGAYFALLYHLGNTVLFSIAACDYPLLILSLRTSDPMQLDAWVQTQIAAHPSLTSRPWAIDVSETQGHVDMGEIIRVCRKYGATLGGVMGAGGGTLGQANSMGLALLPPAASTPLQLEAPAPVAVEVPAPNLGAQLINTPVRSGQQVWGQGRDLIVFGQISPSAEVMADGHLICYGAAKGRLAAGVSGNAEALICVNKLQAELVAINGVFLTLDDLQQHPQWGLPTRIKLNSGRLELTSLS